MEHPMQPLYIDEHDVIRFKPNKILRRLVDEGKIDLNYTARMQDVDREDHEQLAQLIGYSVSGFGDLSYVSEGTLEMADEAARRLWAERALPDNNET